jgi:hypothetical protein
VIPLQVISILFPIAAAVISAPIVTRYENSGTDVRRMTLLHRYTFLIKSIYVGAWTASCYGHWREMAFTFGLSSMWIYLLFDIVLNRMRRPARPWDYLGLNDGDGRFWNGTFGHGAGKWKVVILTTTLIILNILYHGKELLP